MSKNEEVEQYSISVVQELKPNDVRSLCTKEEEKEWATTVEYTLTVDGVSSLPAIVEAWFIDGIKVGIATTMRKDFEMFGSTVADWQKHCATFDGQSFRAEDFQPRRRAASKASSGKVAKQLTAKEKMQLAIKARRQGFAEIVE